MVTIRNTAGRAWKAVSIAGLLLCPLPAAASDDADPAPTATPRVATMFLPALRNTPPPPGHRVSRSTLVRVSSDLGPASYLSLSLHLPKKGKGIRRERPLGKTGPLGSGGAVRVVTLDLRF